MQKIAVLGTGLMGSGFARRMRENGLMVNVWNRSAKKALALAECGALAFETPAGAIEGVHRIHVSLSDDESVDAVLEPLLSSIPAETWIVDHTTTAVTPTAARVERWRSRGRVLVHVPVFMSPKNALEGTGLMLVSGDRTWHDSLLPALQQMTGTVLYVGDQPERAAAIKLLGNLALLGIIGLLGDVNRLANSIGISTNDAFALFDHFNPARSLKSRAATIASDEFDSPSFEVTMAYKDIRLMLDEARQRGTDLFVVPGLAAMFDASIARGEGALDASAAARVPRVVSQ